MEDLQLLQELFAKAEAEGETFNHNSCAYLLPSVDSLLPNVIQNCKLLRPPHCQNLEGLLTWRSRH